MARYWFWIHKKDGKGRPLDESVVKAAEQLAPTLARYRQHEIRCESTTNTMLQSAVEAASRAKRTRPIENPIGYLTFAYKRIVDRFLNRQRKVVAVDNTFLEDLLNARDSVSFEDLIHDRLFLEKLIDSMDTETRQICEQRMRGYSMNEIAKELGITPNSLSARYNRGVKKAMQKVSEGSLESQNHGTREAI